MSENFEVNTVSDFFGKQYRMLRMSQHGRVIYIGDVEAKELREKIDEFLGMEIPQEEEESNV